jgi:DNA primase
MKNPFEEIRARLSVVEVLGSYLDLKNNGQNFKACCPFHNEKTPSLVISPAKDIWHCFGCGLGGDIFKFVVLFENTDKAGALRLLAKKANVTLEAQKPKTAEEKEKAKKEISRYELGQKYLTWATDIYHKILLKQLEDSKSPITQYLKERGLKMETIQKFGLGYAPTGHFVLNLAKNYNLDLDILAEVGILRKDDSNNFKDKFVDRLMLPISDKTGLTLGFTGRVLPHDKIPDRPKYLNSSQSNWFNKSELWYGWSLNSMSIRRQKKAIIVEGNMDVVKAWQCGFDFTLASQGTSFTLEQLKQLRSITDTIWLAFDNDTAGETSGYKLYCKAVQLGFEVYKLEIPKQYKDFDEALSSGLKFESQPPSFVEFFIKSELANFSTFDPNQKDKKIRNLLDALSYSDPKTTKLNSNKVLSPLQKAYVAEISKYTGWKENDIESQFFLYRNPTLLGETQNFQSLSQVQKPNIEAKIIANFNLLLGIQSEVDFLSDVFVLLRNLIGELSEFGSLEKYLDSNKDEIELILQNTKEKDINVTSLRQIVLGYIDQNVSRLLLDEKLKTVYLKLKQN